MLIAAVVTLRDHKKGFFLSFFLFTSASLLLHHYSFMTNAFDLGIEAGVARSIVLKHSFFDTVMNMNLLGDHFEPALLLPGLLFTIWDSAAVTILFQNVCVFLSLYLAYRLAKHIVRSELKALIIAAFFALSYHLQDANRFPFHIEMAAMPLFLMLLWILEHERSATHIMSVCVISLLMCTIKEDVPLTLGVLGLWAMLFKRDKWPEGMIMAVIGLAGFFIIAKYAMPYFAGGHYTHLSRYAHLGSSPEEIIKTMVLRPDRVLASMATPPEKIYYLFKLLLQFALLPILSPVSLLAGFSPLFYNMITTYKYQYMFACQYSITVLPFLVYAASHGMNNLKGMRSRLPERRRLHEMFGTLGFTLSALVIAGGMFFHAGKYLTPLKGRNAKNIPLYYSLSRDIKTKIPVGSRVIAASELQPHFIEYDYAGMFSPGRDYLQVPGTSFFVLFANRVPWPWTKEDYELALASLRKNTTTFHEDREFLVLVHNTIPTSEAGR